MINTQDAPACSKAEVIVFKACDELNVVVAFNVDACEYDREDNAQLKEEKEFN